MRDCYHTLEIIHREKRADKIIITERCKLCGSTITRMYFYKLGV